ncbi:conserved hypothetical protein [Talaromyces stipitatus ATCC 10500]|uniref:C6 finger domain protein n=1 Tax=Talaromyces stipitatus (strain ATCC 10500 / CBS 375.48 / QM 6759 / NRRL 1006) TaxID=441959 RepID=B8MQQ0_TALSN|nr:uncharacterized protein TSTA_059600 [Talaromyces stipitatus ATCC 10500]EED13473.1 conserved hypothetical protein [Talaromyces stipitatus ATCC 10500]
MEMVHAPSRIISANATTTEERENENEKLRQLKTRGRKPRAKNPKRYTEDVDTIAIVRRHGANNNYLAMDEYLNPSLAAQTTSTQHIQVFVDYIMVAWPCLFKCTERSVPISWVTYAASRGSGTDTNSFDLGLRSLTCSFMGASSHDQRLINAGRQLYASKLSNLQYTSFKEGGILDEDILAAAVVLSVYEMYNGSTASAWLYHHSGIVEMMRLRGAEAHTTGFGRAIYIAYRGFIITASLLKGEACFLEQKEWQSMSERLATENAKQPDSSVFNEIAERAFREMVKLPGMLKRVRDLWETPPVNQFLVRPQLKQELAALRAALRGLHTELGITVSTHGGPDNPSALVANVDRKKKDIFVGPVSCMFFDGFSALTIRGIRSGIVLVDQLLFLLTPETKVRQMLDEEINTLSREDDLTQNFVDNVRKDPSPSPFFMIDTSTRPFPIRIESLMDPRLRQGPNTSWTDRIATSYGMLGVRIHVDYE